MTLNSKEMNTYWLLKKLKKVDSDFENSRPDFAFNSTVNWMRALKIISEKEINEESLGIFYTKVKKTNKNQEYSVKAIASMASSLNYLKALKCLAKNDDIKTNSIMAPIAVISWYYCIYNSARAMISVFDKPCHDTHSKTAHVFYQLAKKKLIMKPFCYTLSGIIPKKVEEQISLYKNGLNLGSKSLSSNNYPTTKSHAYECIFSYLSGTAKYHESPIKEKLKKENDFDDFRTKEAREARDERFAKKKISLLTQAFRYRGKANYRDCFYFNYNHGNKRMNTFISDLEIVARKFFMMSSFYLSQQIACKESKAFLNGLFSDSQESSIKMIEK